MNRNTDNASDFPDADWTVPVDPGNPRLGRRTVLAGAAWSVPVIAAAIATPLAAASPTTPTLEFVNGPYTFAACGLLSNATLLATTDGTTPAAGVPVVVTLPVGLSWSDGTTGAKTVTTGASGQVILPPIAGTVAGGTVAIPAVGNSVTTTATTTVTPAPANKLFTPSGWITTPNGRDIIDLDARVTSNGTEIHILTDDGTIYNYNPATNTFRPEARSVGATLIASTDDPGSTTGGYSRYIASGNTLLTPGQRVVTPNGLDIIGIDARVSSAVPGAVEVLMLTSDGTLYNYDPANGTFRPGAGSVSGGTHLTSTENIPGMPGANMRFVSVGNRIVPGQITTPNGLDIIDMDARVSVNGAEVHILTTDGTLYNYDPVAQTFRAGTTRIPGATHVTSTDRGVGVGTSFRYVSAQRC